jgi:hypothetical protein
MNGGTADWARATRSLVFAVTGFACFAYWALGRPSVEATASMREWPTVLWFSATLLCLAVAIVAFGRMVGGPLTARLAAVAGAGAAWSSIANVVEDGLRIDAAFFAFILGTLVLVLAGLAMAVVLARTATGWSLLLAAIPAGTVAGVVGFVTFGGPVLLVTWLAAAATATVLASRRLFSPT